MDFSASPDVTCVWKNGRKGTSQTTLNANTSDALSCIRTVSTERSTIQIFPRGKPNSQLSFAWDKFEQDVPVEYLKQLKAKEEASAAALDAATKALKSGVVAFNANACPAGWTEFEEAYGRFVRGIDKDAKEDPDGIRAPGTIQEDDFKSHEHTRPRDVYDAGNVGAGSVTNGFYYGYAYSGARDGAQGPNTGATGGKETRPKNVALLYCQRQ